MHKRYLFLFLVILSFSLCLLSYAETIKLKNGKTIEAEIIERSPDSVKVNIAGIPITYYLDEIESIDGIKVAGSSRTSFNSSFTSQKPQDIFAATSPAIVYITTQTLSGEQYLGSGFIIDPPGPYCH